MNSRLGKLKANAAIDDDVDDDNPGMPVPPYRIFRREKAGATYDIYLSNPVVAPAAYDDLCQLLRTAGKHDEVNMYLNTPGGALVSGLALIQAMRDSKAHIRTILQPQAFSMGALIFLAGDEQVAPPNSLLMFHHYSGGGGGGKGNEQVAELNATSAWFEEAMFDICRPFLSAKEVREMLKGQDIWMRCAEIRKRLAGMKKTKA